MIKSPQNYKSNPSSLVLHDPDFFLIKFSLQPFFFGLPETKLWTRVSNLIKPMAFREKLPRWAEPSSFNVSFSGPAPELAKHALMKGGIMMAFKWPSKVAGLGQQNLGNERHPSSHVVPNNFIILPEPYCPCEPTVPMAVLARLRG